MFASKAKINVFSNFFKWRVPEGDLEWRKFFQKMLILVFEIIIVQQTLEQIVNSPAKIEFFPHFSSFWPVMSSHTLVENLALEVPFFLVYPYCCISSVTYNLCYNTIFKICMIWFLRICQSENWQVRTKYWFRTDKAGKEVASKIDRKAYCIITYFT